MSSREIVDLPELVDVEQQQRAARTRPEQRRRLVDGDGRQRRRQRHPVGQPGQLVGHRLTVCLCRGADIAEGDGEPPGDRDQGQRRQRHRDSGVVGEHGHRQCDSTADDGRNIGRETGFRTWPGTRRRQPAGDGDEKRGGRPAGVDPGALQIRACRCLEQVDGVGDRECHETGDEKAPSQFGAPAQNRQHPRGQGQQQQVTDRDMPSRRTPSRVHPAVPR